MTANEYHAWRASCVGLDASATSEQIAAAEASRAAEQATADSIASIYTPVTYNGKQYPADLQSLAKYKMMREEASRGALRRSIAVDTAGTPQKLSTPAAIIDLHDAIATTVNARIEAIHDQLQ